jgi:hypothetical protein
MSQITLSCYSEIIICYGMEWYYLGNDKNEVALIAKFFESKFFSEKGLKVVVSGNRDESKSLVLTHESVFRCSTGDNYSFDPENLLKNFSEEIPKCQKMLDEIRKQFDQYNFSDYKIMICVSWKKPGN